MSEESICVSNMSRNVPSVQTSTSAALSVIESSPPGIREILSSVINVSASGMYYEPSCRFCSSPRRTEAEKLVESFDICDTDRDDRVSSFFSSMGEQMPLDIVKNHVNSHMGRGETELKKLEYVSRLATLASNQMTTLAQSKLAIAAVLECLRSVGVIAPSRGLSPAKAQEMKAKVLNQLMSMWTTLMATQSKLSGELWDEGKMISMPSADFQRVFDEALNAAQTPDERRLIVGILDSLTKVAQN